jgi:hypothetical protein
LILCVCFIWICMITYSVSNRCCMYPVIHVRFCFCGNVWKDPYLALQFWYCHVSMVTCTIGDNFLFCDFRIHKINNLKLVC